MSSHFTFYDDTAVTWLWNFLLAQTGNAYGVAGLMGNLWVESHCCPYELETHEQQYTYCWDYTVNHVRTLTSASAFASQYYGSYIYEGQTYYAKGFGLAQWTYSTRKEALYNYVYNGLDHTYLGDMERDANFLVYEMQNSYPDVWNVLCNATSIEQASDKVLMDYEAPRNASGQKSTRRKYSRWMYEDFTGTPPTPSFGNLPIWLYFKMKGMNENHE